MDQLQDSKPRLKDVFKRIQLDLASDFSELESEYLARQLIMHFFRLKSYQVPLNDDAVCQPVVMRKINNAVHALKKNQPIQYILGETDFCNLRIIVNPAVLIPRPETEELVRWVSSDLSLPSNDQFLDSNPHVLDIGTGSGAIALAIKNLVPAAQVEALDISAEALAIAKQNSEALKLEIKFSELDILFKQNWETYSDDSFDLIVSNPPYVTCSEKEGMHERVLNYEPHLALFVSNENPLLFYSAIANFSALKLKKGGLLYFEVNENYANDVIELLENEKFTSIYLQHDMYGRPRMIKGIKELK